MKNINFGALFSFLRDNGILGLIFFINFSLYGYLVYKDSIPTQGLIVVSGLLITHYILNQQSVISSPITLPVVGLGLLSLVTLVITPDIALTMPKVFGLILGISLFFAIMFFLKSLNRLGITIILLIIVSLAVPLAGFLATDWTGSTFTLPSRILARLEQFIPAISRFSAGGGIHVNTLGGTLTFFIPLLLSMLWEAKVIKRTYLQDFTHRNLVMILTKSVLIISLLLSSIILVLTQSRGSYLGVISGVLVYIIWKNPRVYWLIPFLVVILISVFLVFGNGNIQQFISLLDTSVEGDTVQVRLDYWKRTVFLIQDFPFTGVGLGTYGKVFDELYPFTQIAANSNIAFYAHNMYLAVAASMGLPALVLYCAIFSAIISMVISSYRKVRSVVRMLLMGLSCGILANLVYGLWDNYLLGENLAIVLWIYLGVITALYIHQNKMNRRSRADSKERIDPEMNVRKRINKKLVFDVFLNTSTWILLSLTAIAFININPYISLTIAMLGGILLGILLTKRHEKNFQSIESFHSASASTT